MSYPLKKSNDVEDEYFAIIEVINITESVEITLIVSNEFGELRHSFPVNFAGQLPSPDGSVDVTATQAGIALWIIVLVAFQNIQILIPFKSIFHITFTWFTMATVTHTVYFKHELISLTRQLPGPVWGLNIHGLYYIIFGLFNQHF